MVQHLQVHSTFSVTHTLTVRVTLLILVDAHLGGKTAFNECTVETAAAIAGRAVVEVQVCS
jgi:hypothetical protein